MKGEIGLGWAMGLVFIFAGLIAVAAMTPTFVDYLGNVTTSLQSLGVGGTIGGLILGIIVGLVIAVGFANKIAEAFGFRLGI